MTGPGLDRRAERRPWVLVGTRPAEALPTVLRRAGRVLLISDPDEGPVRPLMPGVRVQRLPFRSDPLAVLGARLPEAVEAVVSFTELGLLPAAALAQARGLPGTSVATVIRTRDKLLMRQALRGVLAQPEYGLCGRDEPRTYPVVVKPRNGSGSRGVRFVATRDDFRVVAAAALGGLWEEFIEGAEYSVETVTLGGRHHVLGITEKRTTGAPHFVETAHVSPAEPAPPIRSAVHRAVTSCLDALGVTSGAAHTEIKIRDGEVFLIETHTRAGGDRIPLLTRLVSGHDQLDLALTAVQEPQRQDLPDPTAVAGPVAGIRYFPWQDCVVRAVDGLEACRSMPGVVEAEISVGAGDEIPLWRYSHERPGYVVAIGADRAELDRRLDAAIEAVAVVTGPVGPREWAEAAS